MQGQKEKCKDKKENARTTQKAIPWIAASKSSNQKYLWLSHGQEHLCPRGSSMARILILKLPSVENIYGARKAENIYAKLPPSWKYLGLYHGQKYLCPSHGQKYLWPSNRQNWNNYSPPMAKNIYGTPTAKNIYGPP